MKKRTETRLPHRLHRSARVLDKIPGDELDCLVALAVHGCQASAAILCLNDDSRAWMKASSGLSSEEAASVCRVISSKDHANNTSLPDSQRDDNPLNVFSGSMLAGFGSYAGASLVTDDGENLGVLLVLDRASRAYNGNQLAVLQGIARQILRLVELHSLRARLADQEPIALRFESPEDKIKDRLRIFDPIFNSSLIGFFFAAIDGSIRDANDAFLAMVQYERKDIEDGRLRWDRITPEAYRAADEAAADQLKRHGIAAPRMKEYIRKDGTRVPVLCGVVATDDALRGCLVFVIDLSSHQRNEIELQQREERFRLVIRAARDAVWDWDIRNNTIWWGEGFEASFGGTAEKLEDWAARIHPDDRSRAVESVERAVATAQSSWSEEYRFLRSDGSYAWVEDHGYICRDVEGTPVRVVGAIRDVTQQRRSQTELRRLEERFARAFQASPDPIAIVALDDDSLVDVNDAFLRVAGFQRDQVIGRTGLDLDLSWTEPGLRKRLAESLVAEGQVRNAEVKVRLRNGEIWVGLLSAELVEIDGRTCALAVIKDITEIRRLEEQLRQAQKMDAIGRLAGGIAHDFNNFLTIIHGYSELLLTQSAQLPEPFRIPLMEMRAAAERAAGLTRQLLAFSRQQILRMQELDLSRLIRSSERMLRSAISEEVDLRLLLDPELGRIQADSSQIDQVVLNLVINARDAMPHGGSITIETRNVEYAQPTPFGREMAPAGRWILLSVNDTGHGMNDAVQSRIFEPFYTTKEEGKGTGLGLATVYGIVKQTGGYVAVSSYPGTGSTFQILLPRFDVPSIPRPAESVSRSPLEGSETILLVEDEEAIRLLCREVLESQGYTVLTADNGDDALRLAGDTDGPIHLLLTDLVLPHLSGDALAAALRQQRPGLAVVYMSGLSDDHRAIGNGRMDAIPFLQKPFSPVRLSRTIRDLLDKVSSGQERP